MKKEEKVINKIKLLVLDPVTTAATPAELAYMGRFLSENTELEGRAICKGPASIECEYDEAMALPQVVALARESAAEFDGIFIECLPILACALCGNV